MLTSNQFYGGLNRRFDKRVALLARFGFKSVVNEFGAFMVRSRGPGFKQVAIANSAILHCSQRAWLDKLAVTLNRTGTILPLSC